MRVRVSVVVLVVGLVACTGQSTPQVAPTTTTPAPTPSPTPGATGPSSPTTDTTRGTETAAATPSRPLGDVAAAWQVVGEGYDDPVQALPTPDGRVLVLEQAGRIRTLQGGDTILDLTDRVTVGGERGLLAGALSPAGDRLLLHYSGADGRTVVSAFPFGEASVDPGAETVLFEHAQPAANHNGGSLLFDPSGTLVLALGDGGGAGDPFGNGQDPGTVLAALLRFDLHDDRLEPAAANPFLDGGGDSAVWAYGLRNPWRIAFDQDHLYIADVGQNAVEEVNVVDRQDVAGANFGWPLLEGTTCFATPDCDPSGTVLPVAELRHAEGACAIIGGVVVPEGHPTGLGGAYLYSDRCDTRLRALRAGDPVETAVVDGAAIPASPLGFGSGLDGQVWVGTSAGQVLELVAG